MQASPAQQCRYFQRRQCTGCTALSEPYAKQLAWKENLVRERLATVLEPLALSPRPQLRPIVASPSPMGYRSSVKLCLNADREGRRSVGLYRFGTRDVVHIPGCPAQTAGINRLVERLFGGRIRPPALFFNHKSPVFQRGKLKFLVIRSGPGGEGLIISHTGVDPVDLKKWLRDCGLEKLCAYESRLTPRDGDLPIGYNVDHLSGPEFFSFPLAGQHYQLSPLAFFQANYALSAQLITAATSFTGHGELLLDLYGGFGAYSFALLARMQRLIVVDGNVAAIAAARRNAAATANTQVTAAVAMCEDYLEKALAPAAAREVTHVLVNPPRAGLSRRVLARLAPAHLPALRELHYVSCNPLTLARDLTGLTAQGMRVRDVQPFDMFPQTEHIECVARLVRS